MAPRKGHIIVGRDTDAMSNPMEVQMAWAVSCKNPFVVGSRSIKELSRAPLKRMLVGFVLNAWHVPMPREGHLVLIGEQIVGRVRSCEYSPTLNMPVGLPYVLPKRAAAGSQIDIKSKGGVTVTADIVDLPRARPRRGSR